MTMKTFFTIVATLFLLILALVYIAGYIL